MKKSIYVALTCLVFGCGGPSTTSENSTQTDSSNLEIPMEESQELTENEKQWAQRLDRYLQDFEILRNEYTSINYQHDTEMGSYIVHYYFDDDELMLVHIESSGEGGYMEDYLVSRDPEGDTYLHYGTEISGSFGYAGMDGGEWYKVKADENYKPYLVGAGAPDIFEYKIEHEAIMEVVRGNQDKFVLENGKYVYVALKRAYKGEYGPAEEVKTYDFTEILYTSNLLSATRFDPALIRGYLNWWYPLYEEVSGTFYRHMLCGYEDNVKLKLEAGNYRWEEETAGEPTDYIITRFEESEGDAFYVTIDREGIQLTKTIVYAESDGLLIIDGKYYTSEPTKYDYVTLKCEKY